VNIVKNTLSLVAIVLTFLVVMILPARGAVTVQTITASEFDTLTSTYQSAWSVVYRGGSGGTFPEEIRLARNTATPQVGTNNQNNRIGNLTWSATNNDLEILIDESGNISARANSTTVGELQIMRPFNQILIFLHEENPLEVATLTGIAVNASSVRNMFADGLGAPGQSDVISITNFGSQAPFSLDSVWSPGPFPASDDQYVRIVAIQNATIPEPSTIFLFGIASLLVLRRKR
jgi:hypothetical protein